MYVGSSPTGSTFLLVFTKIIWIGVFLVSPGIPLASASEKIGLCVISSSLVERQISNLEAVGSSPALRTKKQAERCKIETKIRPYIEYVENKYGKNFIRLYDNKNITVVMNRVSS